MLFDIVFENRLFIVKKQKKNNFNKVKTINIRSLYIVFNGQVINMLEFQ